MKLQSDYFFRSMKDLFTLMGWNYRDEQMDMLFERLMREGVETEEFKKAHRMMQDELRFTVPAFVLKVRGFQAERREREAQQLKEQAEKDILRLMKDDQAIDCQPSEHCRQCGKEYCQTMGFHAMKGIDAIIEKRRTTEEVFAEMDRRFPGQGWDKIPERDN